MDRNQKTYIAASVVRHYAQLKALQPAEQAILERLRSQLSGMKMLDIGVGGGRTTQHFAPAVATYIGIDYSAEMIAACQKRFPASVSSASSAQFAVCDARDLSQFADNSFDFILFSFNGIDYVSQRDRLQVLQEVSRVGKPGSYFCFSSHNLQGFEQAFRFKKQFSFNPITTYVNLVMLALLRFFNRAIVQQTLENLPYAIVRDESHNFRLETYYIRPQAQLNQLASNFRNIQVYSWQTGLEITPENFPHANEDLWLYYLCMIK
jgi:ubiquinone/menaquinone biosynthesis C-methylase UbiE